MTYAMPTWGHVEPELLAKIAVVSPHFDDAVMGAGYLIASYPGTEVITVMAGFPPAYPAEVSDWDALGGFGPGDDVVAARREEDVVACTMLGATTRWLDFSDHQYLDPPDRPTAEQIAPSLDAAIRACGATAVFFPMGLGNPDHDVTHNAGLIVRANNLDLAWFCYEDHGYKHLPGLLSWRVARLLKNRPWATPAMVPHSEDFELKRQAIYAYTSQVAPLERDHALAARVAANVPEQFWRLEEPPAGWGALAEMV